MNEAPDVHELATILRREFDAAQSFYSQLSEYQLQAFEYYEGQLFGNEVEGRSQIILPDVQEAIDYMTQSAMRLFTSSDHIVDLEATEEQFEKPCQEATAALNHNFMKQQDGYRLLHDALFDGLLRKYGVFKTVVEEREKVTRKKLNGHELQIAMHAIESGGEIEDVEDKEDGSVDASMKYTDREKVYRDYAVPAVEFRFSPRATHEDEADYIAHVAERTRSQLVEMGFDADQVYDLPAYTRPINTRYVESQLDRIWGDDSSPALQKVLLCEEYCRVDMDGDGIAERIKVFRVENEILRDAKTGEPSIETVEDQPFAVFCPFYRPHKLVGYSLADKVMDIQLGRSFVARQLLDGMAFANMPRPIVNTTNITEDTYADILNPIPGSPIRIKGGADSVQPFQTGFDVGKSLQVMEWFTGERESRTGITRLNQGLDADALNKTATGTALMQAQGQQQEEMIARNLAETVGRLFAKKYRLMKSDPVPIKIKIDGKFKVIDPSQWPDDFNVVVRVGLGSGSKDKRIQYRMALAPMLAEGKMQGLVSDKNVFHAIDGMVRDMELGTGDDYWIDPETPEGQQMAAQKAQAGAQDPKAQAMQAKVAIDGQKLQQGAANDQAKLQLDGQKAQQQGAIAMQTAQMKIDAQREAAAMKLMADRERMATEANLEARRQEIEADTRTRIAETRPGVRLDA
jgi:hypothetical protein